MDKNKVYLEFVGNNADGVTGSCIFVQFYEPNSSRNYNILLELGLMQDDDIEKAYKANLRMLDSIDFKSIDAIFCTHLHSDHSMLLPSAYRRGFEGTIYSTKGTKYGLTPMLKDGHSINKQTVNTLISKGIRAKPYYEEKDISRAVLNTVEVKYNEKYFLSDNIWFKLIKNNHVYDSASLLIEFLDETNNVHKLFYSGDLGNIKFEKHFVNQEQLPIKDANVCIYESTYGVKTVQNNLREKEIDILHKELRHTLLEKNGICLFPTFSFDRTPNILWVLKKIMDSDNDLNDIMVVLDGKLSNELLNVFSVIFKCKDKDELDELLNWSNLKRYTSYKQTEVLLKDTKPKIILSSNGMATNGRVIHYLQKLLPSKNNTVIFTGYSSKCSPARKIKENAKLPNGCNKIVKLDKDIIVTQNCGVLDLHSFSSHIMGDDLVKYITSTNMQKCVLVHGDNRQELKEVLDNEFAKLNKTTKVIVPNINYKFTF